MTGHLWPSHNSFPFQWRRYRLSRRHHIWPRRIIVSRAKCVQPLTSSRIPPEKERETGGIRWNLVHWLWEESWPTLADSSPIERISHVLSGARWTLLSLSFLARAERQRK